MQTTRFAYLAILGVNVALNGLSLLQITGFINFMDWLLPAALLFNLIFVPIAIPWAYRVGELAEEEFRRKLPASEAAAAGTDIAQAAMAESLIDKARAP